MQECHEWSCETAATGRLVIGRSTLDSLIVFYTYIISYLYIYIYFLFIYLYIHTFLTLHIFYSLFPGRSGSLIVQSAFVSPLTLQVRYQWSDAREQYPSATLIAGRGARCCLDLLHIRCFLNMMTLFKYPYG